MRYLLNCVYLLAMLVLSPWLVYKALTTGKYRKGLGDKFWGRACVDKKLPGPTVWLHGVSVGEIHLLRQVVAKLRQRHPTWNLVVSTTTDTGHDEAKKAFPDLSIILWPLDFSWAVSRALHAVNPDLVILGEGELWPNFLMSAKRFGAKVAVLNGRMSPRSTRRYQRVRFLANALLSRIDLILAQSTEYAANYRALGAVNVRVTGNIKYDGVQLDRDNAKTRAMRDLLGIQPSDLIWVVGSTQAPEEQWALDIYQEAKTRFPNLRLIVVPRQKDRFDEVAKILSNAGTTFVRRSTLSAGPRVTTSPIILLDTIGELNAVWGLCDLAFVGGSLDGQRGGQNMIEPAAYGAAVTFGPHVWNFKETVANLLAINAAVQVQDAAAWRSTTFDLLGAVELRRRLGAAAQAFVRTQQGATDRSLDLLERMLITEVRSAAA